MSFETKTANLLHVLAVALVLSLVGMAFLAFVHALKLEARIKTELPYVFELKSEYSADSLSLLMEDLKKTTGVISSSVALISKEEALKQMSDQQDMGLVQGENPFHDLLTLNLDPEQDQSSTIDRLEKLVLKYSFVQQTGESVRGPESMGQTLRKVKTVLIFSTLLLSLLAFFIIGYLVRLYFMHKAPIVRVMHLLGAEPAVIFGPYTKLALVHGLASALMAVSLVGLALLVLYYLAPWLYNLLELKNFILTLFVLLITGPLMHYISIRQSIILFKK